MIINGNDTAQNHVGGAGDDQIYAKGGDDTLSGQGGNDLLDGGTGVDTMLGGDGNDTYYVDVSTDQIIEGSGLGSGYDRVYSRATDYTLSANVERLTLQDTLVSIGPGGVPLIQLGGLNGTGNSGDNWLEGNSRANTLSGMAGNDVLLGNGGNDTLDGGAGNDTLNGGTGDDVMRGGIGNDAYVVDSAGDQVIEGLLLGGTDTVYASVTHSLAANVENLVLTGTALNGTGNAQANVITGNNLANRIDGGTGADDMRGGGGNDTYIVDNVSDTVTESAGSGTDVVWSSVNYAITDNDVEHLVLTGTALTGVGNASANTILGNASNNTLAGLDGNDTLSGGLGNDTLVGGAGNDQLSGGTGNDMLMGGVGADRLAGGLGNDVLRAVNNVPNLSDGATDTFVFNTAPNSATNVDLIDIASFLAGNEATDDEIELSNANFSALGGSLVGKYFEGVAWDPNAVAAQIGIYNNTATGDLYYNPTFGSGGDAILFARVNVAGVPGGSASLSVEEFTLV